MPERGEGNWNLTAGTSISERREPLPPPEASPTCYFPRARERVVGAS
jgi:hypothetical protein